MDKWQELEAKYFMRTVKRLPVTLVRGKGCRVWDSSGRKYLDFVGGWAVNSLGHCHPVLSKAIKDQADRLIQASNQYYTVPQVELAELLVKNSCLERVFFCNSGAEANEGATKLARRYGKLNLNGAYEIITTNSSFHGRTLAMCAATGQAKVQKGFDPLPVGFAFAEFNNLESVKAQVNSRTVAVLIEAVQGEGGVAPATPEFLAGLRSLCDEKGLLLLCDEVQCGMGRTGAWFGWQKLGGKPDAFSLAKAVASGVPMGVLVASPKLSDIFQPGNHASTFCGNPLASAAALATLDVIEEEGLLKRAEEAGKLLREGLQAFVDKYDQAIEVRGEGLMVGLVVEGAAKDVVTACRESGLLCCAAGEHFVRFVPPLNVKDDELEEGLDMIGEALENLYGKKEE